jgi:hypothetical protein
MDRPTAPDAKTAAALEKAQAALDANGKPRNAKSPERTKRSAPSWLPPARATRPA